MKVLFTTYPTAHQFMGGGEIIISKCKEYLEKRGVKVKLFDQWKDKIKDYDVVHNFGLASETAGIIETAKSLGVPTAIHTLYWPSAEYALKGHFNPVHKARVLGSEIMNRYNLFSLSKKQKMMKEASILFPNSKTEAEMLHKNFTIPLSKMHVVHDGIDSRFTKGNAGEFEKKFGLKNFVLYVGRIEPRKNVLALVRAMKDSGIPLVIVGEADSQRKEYFEQCKRHADKNTHFLGRIEHDSSLLVSAYYAAKVLALPTWFETPGIVAMEAGAAGANLVVTKNGCTREYFGDYARYVDPSSRNQIRKRIIEAFEAEKSRNLAHFVRENYSWEKVAGELIEGYKKVV